MPTLEVAPSSFDGLGMSSRLRIDEILRMIDCIVLIELRQFVDSSVGSPLVAYDSSAGEDELLYDRQESCGVTSPHRVQKTSARSSLDSAKKPLLIRDKSPAVILALANYSFIDLDNLFTPGPPKRTGC